MTIQSASRERMTDTGKYIVVWKRDREMWKMHRDIWNTSTPV